MDVSASGAAVQFSPLDAIRRKSDTLFFDRGR
jgi:hypothetical protein